MFLRVNASDLGRDVARRPKASLFALGALLSSPLILGCYGLLSGQPLLASGGFILFLLVGGGLFVGAVIVSLSPRSGALWLGRLYLRGRWTAFITLQLLALVSAFLLALILHIMVSYLVAGA